MIRDNSLKTNLGLGSVETRCQSRAILCEACKSLSRGSTEACGEKMKHQVASDYMGDLRALEIWMTRVGDGECSQDAGKIAEQMN